MKNISFYTVFILFTAWVIYISSFPITKNRTSYCDQWEIPADKNVKITNPLKESPEVTLSVSSPENNLNMPTITMK
ncbi:hypothetical protein [Chryseobacterium angstadtii]|nr:hypothetical protein [Chryseobacterium angstadtii]